MVIITLAALYKFQRQHGTSRYGFLPLERVTVLPFMRLSLAKIPSLMSSRIAGESFSLCSWCFHVLGVLSAWQSSAREPRQLLLCPEMNRYTAFP